MHTHWSPADWVAVFGAVGTMCSAIALATVKILAAIHGIHHDVNSIKDELVAETRRSATAEGRAIGRSEGRRQEQQRAASGVEHPEEQHP